MKNGQEWAITVGQKRYKIWAIVDLVRGGAPSEHQLSVGINGVRDSVKLGIPVPPEGLDYTLDVGGRPVIIHVGKGSSHLVSLLLP